MKKDTYSEEYFADIVDQSLEKMSAKYGRFLSYIRDPIQPRRILDAGCGSGTLGAFLHLKFPTAEIIGLDKFQIPLSAAQVRYPHLKFILCDVEREPFPVPAGSVDLIVAHEVFEHLQNIEHFLTECRRTLADGGRVLLKTPNELDLKRLLCRWTGRTWYADLDKTHRHYYNAFSIKRIVAQLGFKQVATFTGTKPLFKIGPIGVASLPYMGNGLVVVLGK